MIDLIQPSLSISSKSKSMKFLANNIRLFLTCIIGAWLSVDAAAQHYGTTGITAVYEGQQVTYTIVDTNGYGINNTVWQATNGTINSQNAQTATVTWGTGVTSGVLSYTVTGSDLVDRPVLVSITISGNPPATPDTPTAPNTNCENVTLQRVGTPPMGVEWYWQTDPNGTIATNSDATLTITTPGAYTYYLRAREVATGVWSVNSSQPLNFTLYAKPAPPPEPTLESSYCSAVELKRADPPAELDVVYLWQSAPDGTIPDDNVSIKTVTSGSVYYLRARHNQTGCWSDPVSISYTIKETPYQPPVITAVDNCGVTTLTRPEPPAGVTYYWQSSAVGNDMTNSNLTVDRTESGLYYLRPQSADGCWGISRSIDVTILEGPDAPDRPTLTFNEQTGITTMTRISPPSGVTWYWQGMNANGTDETNSSLTYDATGPGDYYIRGKDANGCWGPSTKITISPSGCNVLTNDQNYVATSVMLVPETNESSIDGLTTYQRDMSVQYFDGLGRPLQTVSVEASPDRKHIVQPFVYDQYGREVKKYLPYVSENCNLFQTDPVGEVSNSYTASPQYQFYQTTPGIAHDVAPYAQSILESSPLNRLLKQGAPGLAWQPNADPMITTDNIVRTGYKTNTVNEVRALGVSQNGNPVPISSSGYYTSGELLKNTTEDEDGNEVQEFTNLRGQVVLKRVQANAVKTSWADTYYIYDDLNNLRIVLPPEASRALDTNGLGIVPAGYTLITKDQVLDQFNHTPGTSYMYAQGVRVTLAPGLRLSPGESIRPYSNEIGGYVLDRWAFQYNYDSRNRMVEKRVPGSDWVYMVYDKLDRLVLTQDGNQRANGQWIFTKYDVHSRPILTGFYTNSADRAMVQLQANSATDLYEIIDTIVLGYTNDAFPSVANESDYLTATYYDDYADLPSDFNFQYQPQFGFDATNNAQVKGQVVGTKTRVLDGANTWLKSVVYYDDRYRTIQTIADHQMNDADIVSNKYDFTGRVLETKTHHARPTVDINILEKFTYDHASRLLQATHQVDNGAEVIVVKNEYNALGQLADKKLHSSDNGSSFEQSVDHTYNIRGWLERVNDPSLAGAENDHFGMQLFYNTTDIGNGGLYNGNIRAMKWSNVASGGRITSAYEFSYDNMNRIKAADYHEKVATNSWAPEQKFGLESINYDLNGNIQSLKRFAVNTSTPMDHLGYTYEGNRLLSVDDTGDTSEGFKDGNTGSDDYTYDTNGNMISDANKDITSISYNHLNLPQVITFTGSRSITYTYNAAGMKLTKVANDNGTIKTTQYVGGFIYEDDVLQQVAHAEGRVRRKENGDMVYDYYLKDHLGNTRVTFSADKPEMVYQATMESELSTDEENFFLNIASLREVSVAANKTGSDATVNGNEAVRLNGIDPARRLGPGKMLEVMAKDVVDMEVYAYYSGTPGNNSAIADLAFAALIGNAFGGNATGTTGEQAIQSAFEGNVASVVPSSGTTSNTDIKAYLNYILFNQNFELADAGYIRVDQGVVDGSHRLLQLSGVEMKESGFLYVYVSNEGNVDFDVYFDELEIKHTSGGILQEDHYYPFGANISALSSSAPLSKLNKFLYNLGSEKIFDFDLNVYETPHRVLDPILGRWWQVDPAADLMSYQSPYLSMDNNPILLNDPLGDCPTCEQNPEKADELYAAGAIVSNNNGKWRYLGEGKWEEIWKKVDDPNDRKGEKVLPLRNGWGDNGFTKLLDLGGFRTVERYNNPWFPTQYDVDYRGYIFRVTPNDIGGEFPDISPGGGAKTALRAARLLKLLKSIKSLRGTTWRFGKNVFRLDKKGLAHILKRHHPKYWDGTVKATQTFLPKNWSVKDIQKAISNTMAQNRQLLKNRASNSGMFQIRGTYKGKQVVVGFNNGRIGQMYVQ